MLEVEHSQTDDEEQTDLLRISVSDTGIGISAKDLTNIFEPFTQVDSELNREYSGTGLGLSLVKRFVELHSGTVSVNSEPGKGSCFTLELPLKTQACSQPLTTPDHSLPVVDDLRMTSDAPLILLAEDNLSIAKATVNYLRAFNFDVISVANGRSAIETAKQQSPDPVSYTHLTLPTIPLV